MKYLLIYCLLFTSALGQPNQPMWSITKSAYDSALTVKLQWATDSLHKLQDSLLSHNDNPAVMSRDEVNAAFARRPRFTQLDSLLQPIYTALSGKQPTLPGIPLYTVPVGFEKTTYNDTRYKPFNYQPAWGDVTAKPNFATVATTGSYTDIFNRPVLTRQTQIDSLQSQVADFLTLLQTKANETTAMATGTVVSNAVTVNAKRGRIGLASGTIPVSNSITITFTNSYITANSTITPSINGAGAPVPLLLDAKVKSQANGSCVLQLINANALNAITTTGLQIDFIVSN